MAKEKFSTEPPVKVKTGIIGINTGWVEKRPVEKITFSDGKTVLLTRPWGAFLEKETCKSGCLALGDECPHHSQIVKDAGKTFGEKVKTACLLQTALKNGEI